MAVNVDNRIKFRRQKKIGTVNNGQRGHFYSLANLLQSGLAWGATGLMKTLYYRSMEKEQTLGNDSKEQ